MGNMNTCSTQKLKQDSPPPYDFNNNIIKPLAPSLDNLSYPNAKITKDQLHNRNYVLLIDKSGSMNEEDMGDISRYKIMQESAIAFANTMEKLDPNGIDICFFDEKQYWSFNTKAESLPKLFKIYKPGGGTILSTPLKQALDIFFEQQSQQGERLPVTILIVTDGRPQDEKDVMDLIIQTTHRMKTHRLKDEDIGIQILQIGHDENATRFLTYLDDELISNGACFDIVDTVPINEIESRGGIKQVLINAVND